METLHSILARVTYHAVFDDGFAGVQVAAELPHLDPTELTEPQRRRIAAFGRRYGRRLSLDGPDGAASLFATSRHLRAGMLAHYRDLFDAA